MRLARNPRTPVRNEENRQEVAGLMKRCAPCILLTVSPVPVLACADFRATALPGPGGLEVTVLRADGEFRRRRGRVWPSKLGRRYRRGRSPAARRGEYRDLALRRDDKNLPDILKARFRGSRRRLLREASMIMGEVGYKNGLRHHPGRRQAAGEHRRLRPARRKALQFAMIYLGNDPAAEHYGVALQYRSFHGQV